MGWLIFKAVLSAIIIVVVSEIADRLPRLGALLLTLPIVSIIAFIMTWTRDRQIEVIMNLARETLILVPLGLGFFVPLAFAKQWNLSFWPAFALGTVIAVITIGAYFMLVPKFGGNGG